VTRTFVVDASALIALFRGHEGVFRLFEDAEAGRAQVVFPAAAIAEANTYVQASENAWLPLLLGRITCVPLTEHIAITIGPWPGDLAVRHVVYEARAVLGDVVTLEPDRYRPWTMPLLVF
jgi:hypothetical protein